MFITTLFVDSAYASRDYTTTIKGAVEIEIGLFIEPKDIISASRGFVLYNHNGGRFVRNYSNEEIASSEFKNNPAVDHASVITEISVAASDERLATLNGNDDKIVDRKIANNVNNVKAVLFANEDVKTELNKWSNNVINNPDDAPRTADPIYLAWAKRVGVPRMVSNITKRYGQTIMETVNQNELDPQYWKLVTAIIVIESGGKRKAVSVCGARGLMQLMPGTAKELGVKDSFNAEANLDGGVRHLTELLKQFDGDFKVAALAYNYGSGTVKKMMKKDGFNPMKYEYVKRIAHVLEVELRNSELT
jgi:hypothetical protein